MNKKSSSNKKEEYFAKIVNKIYEDKWGGSYFDYESSPIGKDYKYESERNRKRAQAAEKEAHDAIELIHALTEGNESIQRALIQNDPMNIRYIKNPYVSIQLEAISANPESFQAISNPSQEAIDTFRIVR